MLTKTKTPRISLLRFAYLNYRRCKKPSIVNVNNGGKMLEEDFIRLNELANQLKNKSYE